MANSNVTPDALSYRQIIKNMQAIAEHDSQLNELSTDYLTREELGAPNGVAELDESGTVPSAQLPKASDTVSGAVKLSSSTDSESTTEAANSKAVYDTMQVAKEAKATSDTAVQGDDVNVAGGVAGLDENATVTLLHGGTGASTVEGAQTNLQVYSIDKVDELVGSVIVQSETAPEAPIVGNMWLSPCC